MQVTVAICTWNRAHLLRQTLAQLSSVRIPDGLQWEVLVIDNNSTDDTQQVIREFHGLLPLRSVMESAPGQCNARNRALKESDAELILWTDDDVLVAPDWIEQFVQAAATKPEAAILGGVIEPWFVEPPPSDLSSAFPALQNGYCGLDLGSTPRFIAEPDYVFGANMGFRRSRINGQTFDPALGLAPGRATAGDETDYQRRLSRVIGASTVLWWPAMKVRHYVDPHRTRLPYLLEYSYGKGAEAALVNQGQRLPLWLLKKYAAASTAYFASRMGIRVPFPRLMSGPVPEGGGRVHSLVWSRERQFLKGLIDGWRAKVRASNNADARGSGS